MSLLWHQRGRTTKKRSYRPLVRRIWMERKSSYVYYEHQTWLMSLNDLSFFVTNNTEMNLLALFPTNLLALKPTHLLAQMDCLIFGLGVKPRAWVKSRWKFQFQRIQMSLPLMFPQAHLILSTLGPMGLRELGE